MVVLAGGRSLRFGADKLDHDLDGASLLDRTLAGVPGELSVLVVGPRRKVARPVTLVREDPPGGGPGAALVCGLRVALDRGFDTIVTLPGDAPDAGRAVYVLLSRLELDPKPAAAVGVDDQGREQVLQVALRAAAAGALLDTAGKQAGRGASVRGLLATLDPPPVRVPLDPAATFDIDTREHLGIWQARNGGAETDLTASP